MIFYAHSKLDELIPKLKWANLKAFTDFLLANASYKGLWVVSIEKEKQKRSLNANAYLWGVVYKIISKHTGHTEQELHEIYSRMFLKPIFITYKDKEIKLPSGTSELSKLEFIEYTDKVIAEGASMGIEIPPPNTQSEEFDIQTIYSKLEKPNDKPTF